mgnify:CR=1 FL=1
MDTTSSRAEVVMFEADFKSLAWSNRPDCSECAIFGFADWTATAFLFSLALEAAFQTELVSKGSYLIRMMLPGIESKCPDGEFCDSFTDAKSPVALMDLVYVQQRQSRLCGPRSSFPFESFGLGAHCPPRLYFFL